MTDVHIRSGRSPSWGPAAPAPPSRRARRARLDGGGSRRPGARRARRRASRRAPRCAARSTIADAGLGADLVVIATPDAAIADAAAALAPGLRAGVARRPPLGRVHARRARQVARRATRRRGRFAAPAAVLALGRGRRGAPAGLVVRGRRPRPRSSGSRSRSGMRPFRVATDRPGPRTTRPPPSRPTISSPCSARPRASPTPPASLPPRSGRWCGRRRQRRGPGRGRRAHRASGARRRRHGRAPPRRAPRRRASARTARSRAGAAPQRPRRPGCVELARVMARSDASMITVEDHRRRARRVRRARDAAATRRLCPHDGLLPRRPPFADARGARRRTTSSS